MNYVNQLEEIIGTHNLEGQLDLMLTLIPKGRTRCISMVLAGFIVFWIEKSQVFDNTLANNLQNLKNNPFDDENKLFIINFINELADHVHIPIIRMERVSRAGVPYSVAETAYKNWVKWNDYKE